MRGSAAVAVLALAHSVALAAPPNYSLVGAFSSPGSTFTVGPDGRVFAVSGSTILRQDSVNGSTYSPVAALPAGSISGFGASFMRFSPDGSQLAIGDGKFDSTASVLLVNAAPLTAPLSSPTPPAVVHRVITTPNFDAAWDTSGRMYVAGARSNDFVPIVNRIDLTSGTATVQTVITSIGVASGGLAIDSGRLYVGCGFIPTGQIRSFGLDSLAGSSTVAFADGALVGSFLSASPLNFDGLGNLLAGGGDSFSGTSDIGYAAVVDLADVGNPLRLAPAGPTSLYSPLFNGVTGELLVFDSLTSTIHRYAIPAPLAGLWLGAGMVAARGRRR